MTTFALRAPWYARERNDFDLRSPLALRPEIQKYDSTQFAQRLLADPRDSLSYVEDDHWSYPVPVPPTGAGRERFATHRLVTTPLRKLYQPSHERYYVVVVEVFCDQPGLPRAGAHDDLEAGFVVRRQCASVTGNKKPVRKLARELLAELAKDQLDVDLTETPDRDVRDLWWADVARRRQFEQDHEELLRRVDGHAEAQAWMVGAAGGQWRAVDTPPAAGRPDDAEEELPMWRIPPGPADCEAARTRSLWFGVIPTYSAEHWIDAGGRTRTKLDEHAIYEIRCFVRQQPPPGHEHCPPTVSWSEPSPPFRLADPMDPDGTKNHSVSFSTPDLRRLAARAGKKQGPGGAHVTTPPGSALTPMPFKDIPSSGGSPGPGGSICTFALELFFIVAFFLFLLFLPIILFAFQLWWMLALRFCIPPSLSFGVVADFFAAGGVLADLGTAATVEVTVAIDEMVGLPGGAVLLKDNVDFSAQPDQLEDLVDAMDPRGAQLAPTPPPLETKPEDPLCAGPGP